METASMVKEVALLVLGIVAGLLPWFLEKVGIEVPKPLVVVLGALALVAVSWAIYKLIPDEWRLPKIAAADCALLFLALILGGWWISVSSGLWNRDLTKFPEKPLFRISGKTYTGGVVEIDGKLFEHCTFKDATLMYHGTASYSFQDPTFQGSVYLKTDNKAIHDFTTLREYASGFATGLQAFDIDDTGKLYPLNKSDPTNLKWSDKQITVSDKEFANTTVEADGKRFERCKFTNVTFIYNGIGPTDFAECKILGSVHLVTYSKAGVGLMGLENFLQTVSGQNKLAISGRDASGAIVPFNVTKH